MPRVQKKKFEKQKSFSSRNSALNSSSSLESSIDLPLGKNDCGQQTNTTTTIAEEVGNELSYDTASIVKISSKDNHDIDGKWSDRVLGEISSIIEIFFNSGKL